MSKKSAVNEVDSHNKSRQSHLALEKWWVTQCCWMQLCTTVSMVMTITNCWKLFCYGVKRDHYDKFIGIREFSERFAQDCFKNTFSPDRGTPENNIPTLDEVDDGDTVYTCRVIHFSSCISPSTAVSTIYDMTLNSASTISMDLSISPKKKKLNREGYITGLLEVTFQGIFLTELDTYR